MSDPTIKAALDAAVHEYDVARVAAHGGSIDLHGMSAANRASITPLIAASIAAFLRHLCSDVEPGRINTPALGWMRCLDLAAAVEEAAS